MIVMSFDPVSFGAMAPPALRECTPTRSGSIPDLWSLRVVTAFLIFVRMSGAVIWYQCLLCFCLTSQM